LCCVDDDDYGVAAGGGVICDDVDINDVSKYWIRW